MGHAEYAAGGVDWDEETRQLYSDPEDVLDFDPWESLGPIDKAAATRRFEEHFRANSERHPFGVNMTGTYITLISGFIDLFGWDMLLLAAGTIRSASATWPTATPPGCNNTMTHWPRPMCPCIMMHDDIVWSSGPILRPGLVSPVCISQTTVNTSTPYWRVARK